MQDEAFSHATVDLLPDWSDVSRDARTSVPGKAVQVSDFECLPPVVESMQEGSSQTIPLPLSMFPSVCPATDLTVASPVQPENAEACDADCDSEHGSVQTNRGFPSQLVMAKAVDIADYDCPPPVGCHPES